MVVSVRLSRWVRGLCSMQRAITAPRGLGAFCGDLCGIYDDLAARRAAGSSATAAITTAIPAATRVASRPSLALT